MSADEPGGDAMRGGVYEAMRTGVVSIRAIRNRAWMANLFAAEDLLVAAGADLLVVEPSPGPLGRLGRRDDVTGRLADRAGVRPYQVDVEGTYDHVVVFVNDQADLRIVHTLDPPLETLARRRTLVHTECWPMDVVTTRRLIGAAYAAFDDVFVTIEASLPALRELHPRVHPLLQFADVTAHPPATRGGRPIDVLNYGRREPGQHRALRAWADGSPERWYSYDTYVDATTPDPMEHRSAMARLLAHSRMAVCNFAAFPVVERRAGAKEAGPRFFEALAAGCPMIGDLPTSRRFTAAFAGCDGLIEWPLGETELPAGFHELMGDETEHGRVSRRLRQSAVEHHDVAHRVAEILTVVGVPVPPGVTERIERLARQA